MRKTGTDGRSMQTQGAWASVCPTYATGPAASAPSYQDALPLRAQNRPSWGAARQQLHTLLQSYGCYSPSTGFVRLCSSSGAQPSNQCLSLPSLPFRSPVSGQALANVPGVLAGHAAAGHSFLWFGLWHTQHPLLQVPSQPPGLARAPVQALPTPHLCPKDRKSPGEKPRGLLPRFQSPAPSGAASMGTERKRGPKKGQTCRRAGKIPMVRKESRGGPGQLPEGSAMWVLGLLVLLFAIN